MTAGTGRVLYPVLGPARHGVTRHARRTAEALARLGLDVHAPAVADVDELARLVREQAAGALHLDLTDSLGGPEPVAAAEALAAAVAPWPGPVSLTLHDIPQPAEGQARFRTRADAYAVLAAAADALVVSSRHERLLLQDVIALADAGPQTRERVQAAHVVPLPVETLPPAVPGERPGLGEEHPGLGDDVVVLGFLYPGKGHREALQALALLRAAAATGALSPQTAAGLPRGVTALGPVSDGHEDLVAELQAQAEASALRFRCTGFVADRDLPAALDAAGIPLAAHRNVSASGSLATWMAAGRRPLVPAGRYTEEMERLRPGTLDLVRAAEPDHDDAAAPDPLVRALADGIARAAADPSRTRLAPGTSLAPTQQDAARRLAHILQGLRA